MCWSLSIYPVTIYANICLSLSYCCHDFLLKLGSAAKSLQSCPTLCDPMDCSLPGSSVHGVFQARVLEWGAIAFSDIKYYILFIDSSTIENIHLLSNVQIVFYLIPLSSILYNVWDCIFILFFYSLWIIVTIIINFYVFVVFCFQGQNSVGGKTKILSKFWP